MAIPGALKSLWGRLLGIDVFTGDLFSDGRPILRAPNRQLVNLAVTTTLTQSDHAGRTVVMGGAGAARTFTLPAATGTGDVYKFVVGAVNTSNYLIKVADATDTMDGGVIFFDDGADTMSGFETAATSDTITLNATTTGGASIGDWVELQDIATDQWTVTGILTATGVQATPFSATV